jgi:hypothetical protein
MKAMWQREDLCEKQPAAPAFEFYPAFDYNTIVPCSQIFDNAFYPQY